MDLILVNENDEPIGKMEKMEVHLKGLLHRAYSVFILNEKGEMLLQKSIRFNFSFNYVNHEMLLQIAKVFFLFYIDYAI